MVHIPFDQVSLSDRVSEIAPVLSSEKQVSSSAASPAVALRQMSPSADAKDTSPAKTEVWVGGKGAWAPAAHWGVELALESDPLGGWIKRGTDVVVALTAILVLAPLFIAVALLISLTLGRPVIYAHTRLGRSGQSFKCYKFRTMVADSEELLRRHFADNPAAEDEWKRTQKLRHDPRVTSIGQLLRKSSIDELPQLFNVLRGEMSCVGPRPIVPAELCKYGGAQDQYLKAKPGMTGAWQISGRNKLSYEDRIALDSDYVKNWSFWRDIKIMAKTIPAVVRFGETA